ncbi:MAG: hypothetical protein MUC36_17280 [Planctomycetes bacterium]|nr:hypothetical protein [Planctomycetota bacterium]
MLSLVLLLSGLPAQVVGIDSLAPVGLQRSDLFGPTNYGSTSVHFYPASRLHASGICAGSTLADFAIAIGDGLPSGTSGVFQTTQALIQIGHVAAQPPVAGDWANNLVQPVTLHALNQGPFALPWTTDQWASLPGVPAAGFVWDGVRDVGIRISTAGGPTGTFRVRTSGNVVFFTQGFTTPGQFPVNGGLGAMQVRLTFAPSATCAAVDRVGSGCLDTNASYYKMFLSPGTFDLGGAPSQERRLIHSATPTGYTVSRSLGGWQPVAGTPWGANGGGPIGNESISAAMPLPFAFQFANTSTTVVHASANGYLILGPTSATTDSFSGNGDGLVAGPAKMAPMWTNLFPGFNTTGSSIYFDVAADNQSACITWLDCALAFHGIPVPQSSVTFQIVLRSNGDFEYRYGTINLAGATNGAILVGWSPGDQPSSNRRLPVPFDMSQPQAQLSIDRLSVLPLTLEATVPDLGTTMLFACRNVPAFAPFLNLMMSTGSIPGVDLGFAGAPSCSIYLSGFLGSATLLTTSGLATFPLAIPTSASLIGTTFASQAVAFSPHNAMGLHTSNGLRAQVGL